MAERKVKVFCIGFHKTGTTSIGDFLQSLGYNNCHGAISLREELGDKNMMIKLYQKDYKEILAHAEKYDSLNDNPWYFMYKELDQKFPDSKFILMLRDEGDWIDSCKRYFKNTSTPFRMFLYGKGSPMGNEKRYLTVYKKHNLDVLEYFKDRMSDLLILNLKDSDKEEKIKQFLNISSDKKFPHLNKSGKK